jgi:hypothetical protein
MEHVSIGSLVRDVVPDIVEALPVGTAERPAAQQAVKLYFIRRTLARMRGNVGMENRPMHAKAIQTHNVRDVPILVLENAFSAQRI